jgi:antitoxin YefM
MPRHTGAPQRPAHAPVWSREAAEKRSLCSRLLNPLAYGILIMFNILYRSNLMDAISYTAARTNLAKTMEHVCEDHSPVIITRSKSQSVVMISLEDYEALQETAYLLRAPKNARRLLESVAELEQGDGQEKELLE